MRKTKKSQPLCLAPKTQLELRARVTRLRQLTEMRTAQLNQQRLVIDPAIQKGFRKMLKFLAQQIEELEQAVAALIQSDPLWRELDQAFRTIKGVADRTVARIMAEMPEIGTLSNKTISKLAGRGSAGQGLRQAPGQTSRAWRPLYSARNPVHRGQRGRLVTNRTSSPSSSGCAQPANRLKSSASP